MRTINAKLKQAMAMPMTTPKTKHVEHCFNYIQTIQNAILTSMNLKSQHDQAVDRWVHARHVLRTEERRRLLSVSMIQEPFRQRSPHLEPEGLRH